MYRFKKRENIYRNTEIVYGGDVGKHWGGIRGGFPSGFNLVIPVL